MVAFNTLIAPNLTTFVLFLEFICLNLIIYCSNIICGHHCFLPPDGAQAINQSFPSNAVLILVRPLQFGQVVPPNAISVSFCFGLPRLRFPVVLFFSGFLGMWRIPHVVAHFAGSSPFWFPGTADSQDYSKAIVDK